MKDLESFLRESPEQPKRDVIDDITKEYDILKEPEIFISKEDKFFDGIMQKLQESERSKDVSFSIKPLFNDNGDIDGAFVSFSKKF